MNDTVAKCYITSLKIKNKTNAGRNVGVKSHSLVKTGLQNALRDHFFFAYGNDAIDHSLIIEKVFLLMMQDVVVTMGFIDFVTFSMNLIFRRKQKPQTF